MTENKKGKKDIKLEENEIMRLSVTKVDENGKYTTKFIAHGDSLPMVHALMKICAQEFDLICIPKTQIAGIVCGPGEAFFAQNANKGDESEEG